MRTEKRLDNVYQTAFKLPYNNDSRIVILSDTHRGDGSLSDEFTRNQNIFTHALHHYYKNDFTLIEAGDGDELWEHHNYHVIINAHLEAFNELQKFHELGRYYKIYGNHDIYLKDQNYLKDFLHIYENRYTRDQHPFFVGLRSHEGILLKHEHKDEEVLIVHGHQGDAPNDQFWFFSMLSLKYFWRYLHGFGLQNPSSPVRSEVKRHKIEKNFNKWISSTNIPLICGHTHRIKFALDDELPYYNTGCGVYPDSLTCIEIVRNRISLVRWNIRSNDQGILQVKRNVINGPSTIHTKDRKVKG